MAYAYEDQQYNYSWLWSKTMEARKQWYDIKYCMKNYLIKAPLFSKIMFQT